MHCCIIWAARQEKAISPLAFKVYFAAHEVKYWRYKPEPGEPYHDQPYAFQVSDVGRLLPGVPAAKIARAFGELEALNIVTLTNSGIGFADHLDDVTVNERVRHRTQVMFNQLHADTRDKLVKIPRRILKIIVQCGRRIVRAATLIGMLLTTMLTKRTMQYEGYKGCVKASWIAKVFGVHASRVKGERAKLIEEGWFTREPTTPRACKKFGQWVRLNLILVQPTPDPESPNPEDTISAEPAFEASDPEEPVFEQPVAEAPLSEVFASEDPAPKTPTAIDSPKVQPLHPNSAPKVQPLLNLSLSSFEVIYNNQELPPEAQKLGAYQHQHSGKPTWTNIQPEDLLNDTRSDDLRQEAIQRGHLRPTESDQINFFASIAHALRVAKTNACGLLRTVVENGLWHVISQADEYNGIARLRRAAEGQETQAAQRTPGHPFLTRRNYGTGPVDGQPIELSQDALIVQTITADFQRAGIEGHILPLVQRHGYLQDWCPERWERAEQDLGQARLLRARQRHQDLAMARIQEVMVEGDDEDELVERIVSPWQVIAASTPVENMV
jgi:hypothetical protein